MHVPEGWEQAPLGNLFEFKNGLNTAKEQYGSGYKFVNVMDIFKNDILTESKIIGRVQVTDSQLESYKLEYGDVLFNRTSETFDDIAMATVYLDDAIATFGGFVIRGRPTGNEISTDYSSFLFQSQDYRNQVIKLGQGAIRANIGQKDLSKVVILIPPLQEQQKIAQILSTWDKAISTTEQLITNSQQQKKALMQQLLTGKKRLLNKNGVRFSGEWKHMYLSDLARITKGKALSSKNLIDGDYPVIAGGKKSPYNHQYFTHENIITVSASGAYAGYVAHHPYKLWASDCSVIESKRNSDILFIFQLLTNIQTKLYSLQSGGAQPHVYPKDLEIIKISTPILVEQQKIATVLSAADQEISVLQHKLDTLKQEKKALMQQLLTGKRRVN